MLKTKLILALSLAAVAGMAEAKIPKNIVLGPYCDQMMNLTKNGAGSVSGVWSELTACGSGADVAAGGPTAKNMFGTGKGYALNTDSYPSYGMNYFFVVNDDGNWYALDAAGVPFAGGTWTPAAEGVKAPGKPLIAK